MTDEQAKKIADEITGTKDELIKVEHRLMEIAVMLTFIAMKGMTMDEVELLKQQANIFYKTKVRI